MKLKESSEIQVNTETQDHFIPGPSSPFWARGLSLLLPASPCITGRRLGYDPATLGAPGLDAYLACIALI